MHIETNFATLGATVGTAALLGINAGRGCDRLGVSGGGPAWVQVHALAHLTLGHHASAVFTVADELAADGEASLWLWDDFGAASVSRIPR